MPRSKKAESSVINVKINMENEEIELIEENADENESPMDTEVITHYTLQKLDEENIDDVDLVPINETNNEDEKEITEHVCGKCYKTYSSFYDLKNHLEECRLSEMENIDQLLDDAQEMEKKNICYCCEENLETAHLGHIKCPNCPKSFKNTKSLHRHSFLIHSKIDQFPCDTCNATSPSEGFLKLHVDSHNKRGKPFACKVCGKEFTRKYHLARHELHSSCDPSKRREGHSCKVCNKIFYRLDNLRTHLRAHMGNTNSKDYQCPFCDKAFYGTATLNIHIRTHTGEKPFACDLCDRSCPSIVALRKHRRSHTGERPYSCKMCDKTFSAKEVLNRHTKTHTGERPHACTFCEKSFIQASQLRAHLFYHTGENGFKCPHCDVQFNKKLRLQEHVKEVHSDNPWDCEECKEKFQSKKDLQQHKRKVHKSKKFQCDKCDNILTTKQNLEKHKITYHSNDDWRKCQICGGILKYNMLIKHMKTVHKEEFLDAVANAQLKKDSQEDSQTTSKAGPSKEVADKDGETIEYVITEEYSIDDEHILQELTELIQESNDETEEDIKPVTKFKKEIKEELEEETVLFMDDETLKESIRKLLNLLLDTDMLTQFGWPEAKVEHVLCEVIKQCGHTPADYTHCSDYTTKMRENVKLLFTVVIDNESIKTLLNNHTIDEVIHQVLKMAHANE